MYTLRETHELCNSMGKLFQIRVKYPVYEQQAKTSPHTPQQVIIPKGKLVACTKQTGRYKGWKTLWLKVTGIRIPVANPDEGKWTFLKHRMIQHENEQKQISLTCLNPNGGMNGSLQNFLGARAKCHTSEHESLKQASWDLINPSPDLCAVYGHHNSGFLQISKSKKSQKSHVNGKSKKSMSKPSQVRCVQAQHIVNLYS